MKNKKSKKELVDAKCAYYHSLIINSQNVSKTAWNIINKEVGVNAKIKNNENKSMPYIEGFSCDNIRNVCQAFNDYYTKMVENVILPKSNFVPHFSSNLLPSEKN